MNVETKVIEVVGGIIRRDGKYLLGRRPPGKAQGGLWEFIALCGGLSIRKLSA